MRALIIPLCKTVMRREGDIKNNFAILRPAVPVLLAEVSNFWAANL